VWNLCVSMLRCHYPHMTRCRPPSRMHELATGAPRGFRSSPRQSAVLDLRSLTGSSHIEIATGRREDARCAAGVFKRRGPLWSAESVRPTYFAFVLLLSMIVVQVPSAPCVSILKL
jgi:hypothetical protein